MLEEAEIERDILMDILADCVAAEWYRLKFPQKYMSTRMYQGHNIAVIVCNGELAKRLTIVMRKYEDRT